MPTDAEVVSRLWWVVRGQQSLDEFEDWFIADELTEDTPLQRDVSAVLAETAGSVADEVAIRELASLLPAPAQITSTASLSTVVLSGFVASDFDTGSSDITVDQFRVSAFRRSLLETAVFPDTLTPGQALSNGQVTITMPANSPTNQNACGNLQPQVTITAS